MSANNRNNNKLNRRKFRPEPTQVRDLRTEKYLSDIKEAQILEVNGLLPPVPDVDWNRISKDKVYSFEKRVSITSVSSSTTVDVSGAISFSLSLLPEAASYQNVFDAWRIMQAQVCFMPQSIGLNATAVSPLTTVIDYDDLTTLTQASMLEYDTCMTTMTARPHIRTLVPRKAVAEYSGSAFTGYGQAVPGQWTDSNSANTPYYGVKYVVPVSAAVQVYSVYVTLLIQFRNTR